VCPPSELIVKTRQFLENAPGLSLLSDREGAHPDCCGLLRLAVTGMGDGFAAKVDATIATVQGGQIPDGLLEDADRLAVIAEDYEATGTLNVDVRVIEPWCPWRVRVV
jgi:hypothetical protein